MAGPSLKHPSARIPRISHLSRFPAIPLALSVFSEYFERAARGSIAGRFWFTKGQANLGAGPQNRQRVCQSLVPPGPVSSDRA